MAKIGTTHRRAGSGRYVTVRKGEGPGASKVKFGCVIVTGSKPSREKVKANVERSTKVLEQMSKKLTRPGITLREKKDVPQFSVAEGETGIFVRRLNGRTERGTLVDGRFRVVE